MAGDKRKPTLWIFLAFIILAAAIAAFFFIKCDKPPPKIRAGFDYFEAKAGELGKDRSRILAFVHDGVLTLPYRGQVKGPLGALWDAAGSPEEKLALAEALLAHCEDDDVEIQDVIGKSPKLAESPEAKRLYKIRISHRLFLPQGATAKDTLVFDGPIRDLVGEHQSIEVPKIGTTRLQIRGAQPKTIDLSCIGGIGEALVFEVEGPGRAKPQVVLRELWRADNQAGARLPLKGDLHEFVVLPSRISPWVREKEELTLKAAGVEKSDAGKQYLGLLDYCLDADERLAKLEAGLDVRASFKTPRILFLSKHNLPKAFGGPMYSFDLRLNRADFIGAKEVQAYQATEIRAFHEAGLEQAFMERWTGKPTTSAFDIFGRLRDDFPNHPQRRIKLISDALNHMQQAGGPEALATFQTQSGSKPVIRVKRGEKKAFHISGPTLDADMLKALTEHGMPLPEQEGKLEGEVDDPAKTAILIENGLLAAQGPQATAFNFLLETKVDLARADAIFAPGSILRIHNKATGGDAWIRFTQTLGDLAFDFRVWNSSVSVPGSLRITAKARRESEKVGKFWYDKKLTYDDKVKLIIPGPTYRSLKEGKPGSYILSIKGKESPKSFQFVKAGSLSIPVNGKPMDFPIIECSQDDKPVIILDDPDLPIINIDRMQYISTSLKGRLTDKKGVGIGGAQIAMEGKGVTVSTWLDGSFTLPPAPEHIYGPVKVRVNKDGELWGEVDVNLSAPGRETVQIQVPRKRMEVVWITPEGAGLEKLKISAEATRHIKRHLASGLYAAVPERMLRMGGQETLAYFAFDSKDGHVIAVSEDGLHSSGADLKEAFNNVANFAKEKYDEFNKGVEGHLKDAAKDGLGKLINKTGINEEVARALASIAADLIDSKGEMGMISTLHGFRGSLTAMYGYSRHRIGQDDKGDHKLAILNTLREMDAWAEGTDMFAGAEDSAGGHIAGKLESALNDRINGISGPAARACFKMGYLSAVLHMNLEFGKP